MSDLDENERFVNTDISDLNINKSDVKNVLGNLNTRKSMGPDSIHPKLLKFLSNDSNFVTAVTDLFRKCYDTGKLPRIWKSALVTALHKKNEKSEAENYRPISLTCVLSKIFEQLIRNHLLDHFAPHVKLEQHGFLPRRSCLSNLLDFIYTVYEIME